MPPADIGRIRLAQMKAKGGRKGLDAPHTEVVKIHAGGVDRQMRCPLRSVSNALQCRDGKHQVPEQTWQCYREEAQAVICFNLRTALVARKLENRDLTLSPKNLFVV
jgi:hypothetical protein